MNTNDPLVTSAYVHLVDGLLPEKGNMVVAAATALQLSEFRDQLMNKIKVTEEEFVFTRDMIQLGDRTCKFKLAEATTLIGLSIDYLFLIEANTMTSSFLDFVDHFIRPVAIVIQSEKTPSIYSKEIPRK